MYPPFQVILKECTYHFQAVLRIVPPRKTPIPSRDKINDRSLTWVISQFLLLRKAFHEVELRTTFHNGLQQLATPLHSVSPPPSPPNNVSRNFTAVLTSAHAHTFRSELWVREQAYPMIVLRSRCSVTPILGNLQRIARQVADKTAQYNRSL